ncbi:hypothetical protein JCM8208_007343 [Rhodotorula glutinis]
MSGFLSSLGLSSYVHGASPAREQAAEMPPDVPEDEAQPATPPAASPALDSAPAHPPYTPDHRPTSRFSPNSFSTSSATMSGVLSAHPHFSVFRKSTSATSLDELAVATRGPSTSPEGARGEAARADFSMRDLLDEEVETLATPPNQSPAARKASPKGDRSGSSEASSFHLSLDSAEMHSLNFGDQSSLSLSPAVSPSAAAAAASAAESATRTPVSASPAQTSGVRLVPDSPPTTRTPVPRSRSTSAQSAGKMRSSVGPVQRVQFSPISSCPSPLLSASTLPPPPPPPPAFADPSTSSALRAPSSSTTRADRWSPLDDAQSRAGSGILKYPRTPGTGRSVRFTASVVERTPEPEREGDGEGPSSEDSPSVAVGERSAGRAVRAHEDEGAQASEEGRADESAGSAPSASAGELSTDGDSSVLVASFLSKLQAAIPSPDVSLVASTSSDPPPPPSPPARARASAPAPAPPADLPLISVDPSTPGPAPAPTLFDESNPFTGLNSALGASVLERPDASSASSSSAPSQRVAHAAEASLLGGGDASSRTMSNSASGTFLLQGSLAGGAHAGAPSFGGQSFADLSVLQPHSLLTPQGHRQQQLGEENAETTRPVEVAGSRADLSSSAALGTATPRAPSALSAPQLSSAPAVPSPLRFEAPHDVSMASSAANESHEVAHSTQDTSLRLIDFSSPPPASPARPVETSTVLPSSPLRTSRTSPPPAPATPSSPAATALAPAPALAASLAGSSSSFYRQFMAARARDGLSQSARDEWSRLERGEKASPKDGSRVEQDEEDDEEEEAEPEEREDGPEGAGEVGDRTEASVYYSPQREWHDEREAAAAPDAERSAYVDVEGDDEVFLAESSIVELEEARAAFLSPIVEVTEPESNANTPFEPVASTSRSRARDPPPSQPTFAASLSSSLAAVSSSSTHVIPTPATPSRAQTRRAPATPQSASRIPRPRNPVTPSQNPFLLQLARTSSTSIQPQAVTLLQDLFSTQQDQLAASSSQRFLLSSLVTNLQNEVEHKDAVIRTLKEQVGETRSELKEVEQLALAWEERALRSGPSAATAPPPPSARKTSAALEETVQLLADELETRVREDRALRDDLEAELARARAELARKVHDVRDGEIRLRHAHAALEQADDEREAMKREVELGEERRAEVVRERDELRSRWAVDIEQREQALARLRDEIHELRELGQGARGLDDEAVEREVQRRVDAVQAESQREAQLVRHELVQRDAALADLRDQLRAQRDESDRLGRAVQEERQHAELAHADMADTLSAKESELEEVLRDHDALQQDLDEACARIEAAELERDRLAEAARAKDGELAEQVAQCQTALAAMADLEAAVVRIEAEAAAKEAQLAQVHKELASARRESADVLEKRDQVLAESEKQAGKARKELDALQKENNRLNDLVGKLRRDSADREVKVTKLKKRTAELEEDVFGLNIALDAKQQEAQHWKRQMSTIKLERDSAAAAAADASRSTLAPHVPSSVAPSTAKAYRRTSTSTRLHSTTPFPAEKQARRTTSTSTTRRSSAVDPAISTDDEEHDLTLPPTAYEQTPSRPASSSAGVRKSASTAHLGLGLGLPASSRSRRTSAPQDREKENDAPAPARRQMVLA